MNINTSKTAPKRKDSSVGWNMRTAKRSNNFTDGTDTETEDDDSSEDSDTAVSEDSQPMSRTATSLTRLIMMHVVDWIATASLFIGIWRTYSVRGIREQHSTTHASLCLELAKSMTIISVRKCFVVPCAAGISTSDCQVKVENKSTAKQAPSSINHPSSVQLLGQRNGSRFHGSIAVP